MFGKKKDLDIKIYASYHRPSKLIKTDVVVPVHAGRDFALNFGTLSKKDMSWMLKNTVGDNTGDNISIYNPNFCELTTIYWAAKNSDADYIGHFHYRRILDILQKGYDYNEDIYNVDFNDFSYKKLAPVFSNYDAILSMEYKCDVSVYEHYKKFHKISDLETVLDVIRQYYPDYVQDAEEYLANNMSMFCNVFILKRNYFQDYCTWLFDIFEKAAPNIVISEDSYQSRVYGFLAERLYNIFIRHVIRTETDFKFLRVNQIHLVDDKYKLSIFGLNFTISNSKLINITKLK